MMDTAAAAAMSDPERNPAFRRRWQDDASEPGWSPPPVPEPRDAVELTGRELLKEWRHERARQSAPT